METDEGERREFVKSDGGFDGFRIDCAWNMKRNVYLGLYCYCTDHLLNISVLLSV